MPVLRHESVSAGASQLLLPWIEDLLCQANQELSGLDAIAVGIGPGAFTGVRLGVAATQGLAFAANLPVLPVPSLDAIAAQVIKSSRFIKLKPDTFVVAIDARMDEIYWAQYEVQRSSSSLAIRIGNIHLSRPEEIDLINVQYLAGSAIKTFGERLFVRKSLPLEVLDSEIAISALGIIDVAQRMFLARQHIHVNQLEPLYIRNKVALTTHEREIALNRGT